MKILLGLVFALALVYFWHSNKQKRLIEKSGFEKVDPNTLKSQDTKNQYRCVVIKPGSKACPSANALKNKAILMDESISLPLQACDEERCTCKFLRYDDRRMHERRNGIYVSRQIMVDENNHRVKEDRRQP
ncbi:MAG: hypothetical protein V3U89_01120 [Methylophilaceae bacterium]